MKYCVFGAALDTGNLGVSALGYSILNNLNQVDQEAKITLFDNGRGLRRGCIVAGGRKIEFDQRGAVHSKRYYRSESLWTMRLAGFLSGCGNKNISAIKEADFVLDISGGDSFTDLYGEKRFNAVALTKLITLEQKRPLILLPQTYGPFRNEKCRKTASDIVKAASQAWARDERNFEVLKDLLGDDLDLERHRCSVDVAFSLPVSKPDSLSDEIVSLLDSSESVVGINVSGLMYHDPVKAKEHYSFKADYNEAIKLLLEKFLRESDCKIILVPHVVTSPGHYESDVEACEKLLRLLGSVAEGRAFVAPSYDSPCEIKWLISQLDWFCGMRMHSTIAALSSGVPTAAVSYSPKTLGVFETCGQGEAVVDPCITETSELVAHLWSSWLERDRLKSQLSATLPKVCQMASQPFERLSLLNN